MRSRVFYPMFRLSHLLGIEAARKIDAIPYTAGLQEYLFAHMTDAENDCSDERFARLVCRDFPIYPYEELLSLITYAGEKARQAVEELAQEIARIHPGVLAVSSIFSQINGALAVIKRVKELAPDIATILGGTNVSGEAGAAVLRHYPSVDYVFFGEGDEVFARVCRIAMGAQPGPMPYGVVKHGEEIPDPIPHRMTQDMNKVCYPDYSDYIDAWNREQAGEYGPPMFGREFVEDNKQLLYLSGANYALYLEGSRGCWWGQKHPCSFCGLNGRKNVYRYKTAERLRDEILGLSERYGNSLIQLTDNILSFDAMEHLLPMLAESGRKLTLVGEVKTNLKERDIEKLVQAGFRIVQPGIESLNDHLLDLMNKGNNAAAHVAFLKNCRRHHLGLTWNLLIGIPGEKAEDYEEMTALIPRIVHFQPPTGAFPIMFQRYSRYLEAPEDYGLELEPEEMNRYIYGDNDDRVENLCMYYRLTGGAFSDERERMHPLYDRLYTAVYEWKRIASSGEKRALEAAETEAGLLLIDSRPCMVRPFMLLTGLKRAVFDACDEAKTERQLLGALRDTAPEAEILAAAEELTALNVIARLGGRYISLALPTGIL
jgi:magnesium-protoporphyrin IX monomethyl ester (oxidative) cyclase